MQDNNKTILDKEVIKFNLFYDVTNRIFITHPSKHTSMLNIYYVV